MNDFVFATVIIVVIFGLAAKKAAGFMGNSGLKALFDATRKK